jgi:hypothetical protein
MLVSLKKDMYLTKMHGNTQIESVWVNKNDIFKVIKTVSGTHTNIKYQTRYLLKENDIYTLTSTSPDQFSFFFRMLSK